MRYMHYGVAAYFSRSKMFSITYIINRGGPTAWPPRSPDLNPLNFYLWGHLKTLVYVAPVDSEEALHHRIVDVCQTIRNHPRTFEWVRWSMRRSVEACTESYGRHFEHLLEIYIFTYNTKIKCFRIMLVWTYFLVLVLGTRAQNFPDLSFTPYVYRTIKCLLYCHAWWTSMKHGRLDGQIEDDWKQQTCGFCGMYMGQKEGRYKATTTN
jgi:hypothetical protein